MIIEDISYPDIYEHFNSLTPIPPDQWKKFTDKCRIKKVKKKEPLLRAGDSADKYYIVISGLLRMYYTDNDGNEFIKAFRERFDLASPYGEMIQQRESRISIDAIEDSEILEVNY